MKVTNTLGLSAEALAAELSLGRDGGRTVRRWEAGTRGISEPMDKLIRIKTERTEK